MHAALVGVPSQSQARLLHGLIREFRDADPEGDEPADLGEVSAYLDRLELHARNLPEVPQYRRDRLADMVAQARREADAGTVPSRATLAAWQALPSTAQAPSRATRAVARPYHKRFSAFHQRTVEATDALFASRPSQLSHGERDRVFRDWVTEVSGAYGMEPPTFRWDVDADDAGGGYYRPADHSITMSPNHPSVTTLIHEFRHAMQAKEAGAAQVSPDIEVDARAWSLSLYYQVRPRLFERLVREGRIFHVSAKDLSS